MEEEKEQEQEQPEEPQSEDQEGIHSKKPIIIAVLVIALIGIGVGAWYLWKAQEPVQQALQQAEEPAPPVEQDHAQDWNVYTNDHYGYSFKYPEALGEPDDFDRSFERGNSDSGIEITGTSADDQRRIITYTTDRYSVSGLLKTDHFVTESAAYANNTPDFLADTNALVEKYDSTSAHLVFANDMYLVHVLFYYSDDESIRNVINTVRLTDVGALEEHETVDAIASGTELVRLSRDVIYTSPSGVRRETEIDKAIADTIAQHGDVSIAVADSTQSSRQLIGPRMDRIENPNRLPNAAWFYRTPADAFKEQTGLGEWSCNSFYNSTDSWIKNYESQDYQLERCAISPDGKHKAFSMANHLVSHERYIVNDGIQGLAYDFIDEIVYSPDSSELMFRVRIGDAWHVVVNGELSQAYDAVSSIFYLLDGEKIIVAKEQNGPWEVMRDSEVVASGEYIDNLFYTENAQGFGYRQRDVESKGEAGAWHAVLNGTISRAWDYIDQLMYIGDGRAMFRGRDEQGIWHAVVMNQSGEEKDIYVSPDVEIYSFLVNPENPLRNPLVFAPRKTVVRGESPEAQDKSLAFVEEQFVQPISDNGLLFRYTNNFTYSRAGNLLYVGGDVEPFQGYVENIVLNDEIMLNVISYYIAGENEMPRELLRSVFGSDENIVLYVKEGDSVFREAYGLSPVK